MEAKGLCVSPHTMRSLARKPFNPSPVTTETLQGVVLRHHTHCEGGDLGRCTEQFAITLHLNKLQEYNLIINLCFWGWGAGGSL